MQHSTSNQPLPEISARDASTSELIVVIFPGDLDFTDFIGTRAMLEDEGLIPADIKWPTGFENLNWKDGAFNYWLVRQRPIGAKGHRNNFLECDWWSLRRMNRNAPSDAHKAIMRKQKELRDEIYRQSRAGQAEHARDWKRSEAARRDEAFQAFKALVPGLARPKRGRPRKDRVVSST